LYSSRGWSRNKIIQSAVVRIAQDLSARCAVSQGHARRGDYRDDLHVLISTRFTSRRDFCRATGLSEDMLSHVLAGRKDLSIEKLAKVLAKIGYGVHIVPLKPVGRAS
jgi:predicted transcriptional regulator